MDSGQKGLEVVDGMLHKIILSFVPSSGYKIF